MYCPVHKWQKMVGMPWGCLDDCLCELPPHLGTEALGAHPSCRCQHELNHFLIYPGFYDSFGHSWYREVSAPNPIGYAPGLRSRLHTSRYIERTCIILPSFRVHAAARSYMVRPAVVGR